MLGTFVWIVSVVRFRTSFFQILQFFDLDLITLGVQVPGDDSEDNETIYEAGCPGIQSAVTFGIQRERLVSSYFPKYCRIAVIALCRHSF